MAICIRYTRHACTVYNTALITVVASHVVARRGQGRDGPMNSPRTFSAASGDPVSYDEFKRNLRV